MPDAQDNHRPTDDRTNEQPIAHNANLQKRKRRLHPSTIFLGAILGALVTGGFLFVVGVILNREIVPPLTRSAYDAAVERWEEHRPTDYDCELEVFGNRPGKIEIQVRANRVARFQREGSTPSQPRTWEYWTVDGQLETIGQELDMLDKPSQAFGGGATGLPSLNARFNPEFGYPEVYRRFVPGTNQDMSWKVVRFQVVDRHSERNSEAAEDRNSSR